MATERQLLERISVHPDVFGGKPMIRDMRIAVEHILGMLAGGETAQSILKEYPYLESEDIRVCFAYVCRSIAGEQVHERILLRATR